MKLGFAIQLWMRQANNQDLFHKVLDEMSLAGFDGIELAWPFVIEQYGQKPAELRRLIAMHEMQVAATYVGLDIHTPETLAAGEAKAKAWVDFYSQVGCEHLLLDGATEKPGYTPFPLDYQYNYTPQQLQDAAAAVNRIARYAKAAGMHTSWHTHWGNFFENQELFKIFWDETDPEYLGLCPDVGQIQLVGLDPVAYVRDNIKRITHYVHYKDMEWRGPRRELWPGKVVPDNDGAYALDAKARWCELGRGVVDLPAIHKILLDAGFDGWITCDQDCTHVFARTAAEATVEYMNQALGCYGERALRQ